MKTKWKKSSTIPRSIPSMNQNLLRQMELDWDTFIRSFDACWEFKLSKTEREWFSVRFLSKNLSAFEGEGTIPQKFKKACPDDLSADMNGPKHFTNIFSKFEKNKKLQFRDDKHPELLEFLEREFEKKKAFQQANLKFTRVSRSQEMAEALCLLDYGEQEKRVKTWWRTGDRAQAFFVEVDSLDEDRTLQKWLVKRLQRLAERKGEPPKYLEIDIPRSWGENAVDHFWGYLRRKLNLADDLTVPEILEKLKQLCTTKTVIIALYGVPRLGSQVNEWLKNVWTQLGTIFDGDQTTELRSRLLMFVTSDRLMKNLPILGRLQRLPCLEEITIEHVENWRYEYQVIQWEDRCRDESQATTLDEMMKSGESWGDPNPSEVLGRICRACGFSGVEDVERHWDLVGEVAS